MWVSAAARDSKPGGAVVFPGSDPVRTDNWPFVMARGLMSPVIVGVLPVL